MHDLYSLIDKHILYPAYYWRAKDPKLNHLKVLERQQYWPREQLELWQLARLQKLVKHAYDTVPFYKSLYDEVRIKPDDIRSVADLALLPCITKQDIQEQGGALISSQYKKSDLVADASGGSTGLPTHFYKDKRQYQLRAADQIRHDRWSGWDLGDPYALIWGAQKDIKALDSWKQRIVTKYIHRILPLDAFDLTVEKMSAYADRLQRLQPPMILGYANALATFAQFLVQNQSGHKIRPKGIISSAEALSEEQRTLIESTFKAKVLNRYGSREVGLIASECGHQSGLHINADNVLVEIGKFSGRRQPNLCDHGEQGEIIVTDLWNLGMPFIRYRMGDEGSTREGACPCGRTLPLMGPVTGRVSDFVIALDGTRIHGEYFTHLFYDLDEVRQFQLIQHQMDDIEVKIVAKKEFTKSQTLIAAIQKVCGADVKVRIVLCERIPPTRSGKYLFTISKVGQ